jgi:hypothetical protein
MNNHPHNESDHPAAAPSAPVARDLYPLNEARERLGGASNASLYRWAKQGKIRLVKLGGRTFVSAAEIARLAGAAV